MTDSEILHRLVEAEGWLDLGGRIGLREAVHLLAPLPPERIAFPAAVALTRRAIEAAEAAGVRVAKANAD
ncbi:MAG: hypothetical protein JSR82_22550 [Verrucomicrobia bacterium]|nr:hypothetical protein [Verrucomicrobiota bacterium]